RRRARADELVAPRPRPPSGPSPVSPLARQPPRPSAPSPVAPSRRRSFARRLFARQPSFASSRIRDIVWHMDGDERDAGVAGEIGGHGRGGRGGDRRPLRSGFREMALRRMAEERRRLVTDLTAERQAARLSQTEVAARMGTSQSAVARLESGEADTRASTLERYAAAIGCQITWRLQD